MSFVSIIGVGARTPLGLNAAQTGFSLRTGMPVFREAPLVDAEGENITMGLLPTLDPHLVGLERAEALALPALEEALSALGKNRTGLRARLALCLDEHVDPTEAATLGAALCSHVRASLPEPELDISARGAASAAYVLPNLVDALVSGRVDIGILGGVHTDYDPRRVASLEAQGRLFRPPTNLTAVLPGESAAFVLLASPSGARKFNFQPLATIEAFATAFEEARPDNNVSPFRATALTALLRSVLGPLEHRGDHVGWMLTDLGLETFKHFEHQAAITRNQRSLSQLQYLDSPSQRMGDLGAAVMPLHLVLAGEAFTRGYAPHRRMLSLAGSDGGERGAVLVAAPLAPVAPV